MKLEIDDEKIAAIATQAAMERITRVVAEQADAMFAPKNYRSPAGEGHEAVIALVREAVSRALASEDVRGMVDARVKRAMEDAIYATAARVAKGRLTQQMKITEGSEK